MRRLVAYLTAILMAISCTAELVQRDRVVESSLEGAPGTITFSVPDIPVLPGTKSLSSGDGDITDTPYLDPDMMYLVVCGGSQSIKYIRKATLIDAIENFEIPENKYPLSEGDRHTTLYRFRVQLELSDFARTIHILGNVDENQLITGSYSYQSLPNMLSFDNKQAYWQKLVVPHIKAKMDPDTQEPIVLNGSYVPDDETLGFFQYIPLIRNFAKIQVTNASENFQLHSYAVIYYPERGSVVPYRSNEPVAVNRFDFNPPSGYHFSGYEKSTFEELEDDINYLGNMPASVALSDVIPPASEFEDPSTSDGRVLLYDENDTESGFYVYERGIPNEKIGPTFIIVCGKFNNEDDYYYYRLDLMESKVENNHTVSRYYPIYRNFRYNIQLHRISSEGVHTPELAAVSSGAEDISADVSMRHLSDISNGTTRLVVEPFMTRTYSGPAEEGSYYELYARFFDDVYSDVPNLNIAAVRVELVPMTDGSDDILILYDGNGNRVPTRGFFFPEAKTEGGVEGIRTIRFNTVEPQDETKTQKIKITGHTPGNPQDLRLYREVEITLQKKQPLVVTCSDYVLPASNSPITVGISIPSELPESMFPLDFIVEPESRSLTPDTDQDINLPVGSGRSIATTESTFKDTPAFFFTRTLTWEEFSHLTVSEGQRTFYCYFKSTQANSATTVWVYNEYFHKGNASFGNILPLSVTCTDPVRAVINTPVSVGITVPSGMPQSMFPLVFTLEPDVMTLTTDTSKGINMPEASGQFTRTLSWNEYSKLPVSGDERTFYCYFLTTQANSATTIRVHGDYFVDGSTSFENILPLTVTCTDPVLNVVSTPITVELTIPSDIQEYMFPLDFIIEPMAMTISPDISQGIDMPLVSGHFIRTLTWAEYLSLPVSGDKRTFGCYFLTTQAQSATTIQVSNEHFETASVSFLNSKYRPDNHFYVKAIENCTVKLSNAGEYKIDDGEWTTYIANQSIPLTAGQKARFCVGSASSPVKAWDKGKFSCTNGKFEIGGNLASLVVGDSYVSEGSTVTGATFLDFLKANTNLIDAYNLELPMLTISDNAYKSMFDSCTNLERGPQLLPGTNLGNTCYRNMFYNCAKLENAPVLAATKLSQGCYQRMFYGCSKISYIKMLGTQNYRDDEFISDGTNWCAGVATTGELWLDGSLNPVTNYGSSWNKIVPAGWTVKYVGIDDQ